jgi:hypothetical protein
LSALGIAGSCSGGDGDGITPGTVESTAVKRVIELPSK